ncbi:MAG: hypothetical protein II291_06285 [Succinivibrio sp.]|nr:hypothetical protein [Succinivibrio sp.]
MAKFIDSVVFFLMKKDENSSIKYKNLVIAISVVVAILIAVIISFASCSSKTMIKHPADVNSEEVSFEDNNAIAVDPTDENELAAQSKLLNQNKENINSNELQPIVVDDQSQTNEGNHSNVNQTEQQVVEEKDIQVPNEVSSHEESNVVFLYCNKYKTPKEASQTKASIAFSLGMMSSIVNKGEYYQLKLGPFRNREEALNIFGQLDKQELVDECTLERKE